jgi:hypothetical protein
VTTPKETYQQAKADLLAIQDNVVLFEASYSATDNYDQIDEIVDSVNLDLGSIETWINDNLLAIEQNEVMQGFLQQLKVLMTEYDAVFEIGDGQDGYGESYGGGTANGIKVKVSKDGVSSERVFTGNSLSVEDL